MDLRTLQGRLALSSAFRLVATGYLIGAGVLFVPIFTLVGLTLLATDAPAYVNGEPAQGGARVFAALAPIIMAPIVVAMQALMIGGLTILGLVIYRRFRPIQLVAADDTPT